MRGRSKPVPGSNVRVTFHSGLELLHEGETIGYAPTLHDLSIQDPQNVDPLDAHLPIGHAHPPERAPVGSPRDPADCDPISRLHRGDDRNSDVGKASPYASDLVK